MGKPIIERLFEKKNRNKMTAVLKYCTAVLKRGNNHGKKEKRHNGIEVLRSSAG